MTQPRTVSFAKPAKEDSGVPPSPSTSFTTVASGRRQQRGVAVGDDGDRDQATLSVVSATVLAPAPRHASSASDYGELASPSPASNAGVSPAAGEEDTQDPNTRTEGSPMTIMGGSSPMSLGGCSPFSGGYDSADDSAGEPSPSSGSNNGGGQSSPRRKNSGSGLFSRFWRSATELIGCSSSPCSANKNLGSSESQPRDFTVSFEDIDQVEMIGSGAMGCVYKGIYNGESVAIKKFRNPDNVGEEARDLKSLNHVNIVRLQGVCIEDPVYCIVMELCLRSVHDVIKGTRIGPELVCNWAKQVACGMEYLHGKRIVHRDLKTPNVLIAQDERTLKISDFGTSRRMNGSKETKMSFCGSVAWMAPEMVKNQVCTGMVDVWSFGVVLWELLTGQQPYDGVDQPAILYGIGTGNFHLPVPTTTPTGFSLLLKQCWNQNPQHRPKFRQILLHLQIVEDDSGFLEIPHEAFFEQQVSWKREMKVEFGKMKLEASEDPDSEESLRKRRERELKHAEDIRRLYEERLQDATSLLAELRSRTKAIQAQSERKRSKQGKRYRKTSLSAGGGSHSRGKRSGLGRPSRSRSRIGSNGSLTRSGASTPQQIRQAPKGSKAERLRKSLERAVLEVGVREALADLVRSGQVDAADVNMPSAAAVGSGGTSVLTESSPLGNGAVARRAMSEPVMIAGGGGGGSAAGGRTNGNDTTATATATRVGMEMGMVSRSQAMMVGLAASGSGSNSSTDGSGALSIAATSAPHLLGGPSVAHIPDNIDADVPPHPVGYTLPPTADSTATNGSTRAERTLRNSTDV